MEELITMVAQKTGIPPEQAKAAVETVLGYVKGKLPPAVGGQIDQFLSGGNGTLDDLKSKIGGLFGK
ncbi:DUF2267 domain-containing protein [Zavarzinella formosa]|uniref:hypothetical protein n=1 Tax=Zavarzinella formosa TaxID=360055 RepID=UPI0002EC2C20|nr:hypothetical protein [Zavarzinella formosa]